jgi:hypothetical protein
MSPFLLLYALTRPGAIAGIIIVIVLFSLSPTGRRGRIKGRIRLFASNVFRERRGEASRQFDYWKALCMGLGVGILVCMTVAMIVLESSDEVSELAGGLSLLVLFFSIMLMLAAGGYLAYRIASRQDLGKYAVEYGCTDPKGTAVDVDYAACAQKMGFSEKEVAVLSAQKKDWSKAKTNMVIAAVSISFAIIVSIIILVDW